MSTFRVTMARRSRILVLNVATRYCDSRRLALESHRGRPAKTRKLKYIHQQNPERGLANQAQARSPRSRSVLKWSLPTVPASQQRGQAAVDRLTSDGPGWYTSVRRGVCGAERAFRRANRAWRLEITSRRRRLDRPAKTEAIRLSASDEYLLPSEASRMMRRFLEGENAAGRHATNVMRGS